MSAERTFRRRRGATAALAGLSLAVLIWSVGPDWVRSPADWWPWLQPLDVERVDRPEELPPLEHPAPEGMEQSEFPPGTVGGPAAAMASSLDWYTSEAFGAGEGFVGDPSSAWRAANPYRSTDFASPYVNVIDGARRTWRPPPCACRRVQVWMFGGSTTFGLNQRDEHTIASELARVAWEHDIVLDVSNRGRNGHLHWIEAELFALDLTVDEPPDLVVFYDGWNDSWAAGNRRWLVDGVPAPVDPTLIGLWDGTGRSDPPVPDAPSGAELVPPVEPEMGLDDHARALHDQYDRTRSLSRATAERHGVVPKYVWQPSRYSRDLVPDEPHFDTDLENWHRAEDQVIASHLADDVIDLTDALDGNSEPLFTDDIHHNELGARLVAEALFEQLRPDLERLASRPGG